MRSGLPVRGEKDEEERETTSFPVRGGSEIEKSSLPINEELRW